jgi:hypothetical protein
MDRHRCHGPRGRGRRNQRDRRCVPQWGRLIAGPGGDPSCTPAADYAAHSTQFAAPQLPCWSLIAKIGNGRPFEVGTSILNTTTAGKLYLGVNADSFSSTTQGPGKVVHAV